MQALVFVFWVHAVCSRWPARPSYPILPLGTCGGNAVMQYPAQSVGYGTLAQRVHEPSKLMLPCVCRRIIRCTTLRRSLIRRRAGLCRSSCCRRWPHLSSQAEHRVSPSAHAAACLRLGFRLLTPPQAEQGVFDSWPASRAGLVPGDFKYSERSTTR
jgi:hypothetical protein